MNCKKFAISEIAIFNQAKLPSMLVRDGKRMLRA